MAGLTVEEILVSVSSRAAARGVNIASQKGIIGSTIRNIFECFESAQ